MSPDILHREDYEVKSVPLSVAKDLTARFHYSRGGSNTGVYFHGLILRLTGEIQGVAWWLPPTRVACESVNKAEWKRVLSLTRLVCVPHAPKNSASFLLGASIRLIRKEKRFISVVTYADESQGHSGAIYKASNWTYVGKTGPYPRWIDPLTGRQVACKATKNRKKAEMEALGYQKTGSFFKHKFVLHL